MLEKTVYIDAFEREAAALALAAQGGLDAPIPSCPGWTIATLLSHLIASVYAPRIQQLKARPQPVAFESYEDLGLPSEYKEWFDGEPGTQAAVPPGLVPLYTAVAGELGALLAAASPEDPIQTWWPRQQNVGFLQRRMALETAVHRWDAQRAFGEPEALDCVLAADGIDETFDIMLPSRRSWTATSRQGSGETYHFHRTDGPGEWLLHFTPEGPVVTREHARGDVALRGPASDLLLFLWQRVPAEKLEIFGDTVLVARYFELVPPD